MIFVMIFDFKISQSLLNIKRIAVCIFNFVQFQSMHQSAQGKYLPSFQKIKGLSKPIPKTAGDEEDQQAQIIKIKGQDLNQKSRKSQRWTLKENKLYIKFLEQHAHLFRYKSVRRVRQIFILLSDKMKGSRTPAQCKSHHQKMRKATQKGTIKQIVNYMKHKHIYKQPLKRQRQRKEVIETQCCPEQYRIVFSEEEANFEIRISLNQDIVENW